MFSLYKITGNYASSYDKKIKPQNSVATSSEDTQKTFLVKQSAAVGKFESYFVFP